MRRGVWGFYLQAILKSKLYEGVKIVIGCDTYSANKDVRVWASPGAVETARLRLHVFRCFGETDDDNQGHRIARRRAVTATTHWFNDHLTNIIHPISFHPHTTSSWTLQAHRPIRHVQSRCSLQTTSLARRAL